jgi:mono/diheme cytochrome c family protein
MFRKSILAALLLLLGTLADAAEPPIRNSARGELLYSTFCVACHNTQVHWRDKALSTDWKSLRDEVDRWQANSALGWNTDDVEAVARYLNRLNYGFPIPE